MEKYIEDFLNTINQKESFKFDIMIANDKINNHNPNLPIKIRNFYSVIEYFITSYPRCFEIYPLTDTLLEGRYLLLSKINYVNNICFDTSHLNSANEWDITCYDNKYIITKTVSS